MSDTSQNEFETVDENAEPGQLRQRLEQAIAALKAKDKELAELKTVEAQRSVKATWDELKVPDVIRKLYNGDTSADAIKAWWEDSKGLFNIEQAAEQPSRPEPTPEQVAQQKAAQQFQEASGLGTNAINSGFDAAQAKAQNAIEAYRNGQMSRADFEAAKAEVYGATNTPAWR